MHRRTFLTQSTTILAALPFTSFPFDMAKPVFGHQNKIENLKTQWVFKKNLKASDPTWKLVDVDNIPFTEI